MPKICLKEEIRGILYQNPTKWGKEFKKAMDEVREGGIWETAKNGNKEELEDKLERAIRIKTDQEIQHDWNKPDKSKVCKEYNNKKDGPEIMEKYWEDKEIREEIKET